MRVNRRDAEGTIMKRSGFAQRRLGMTLSELLVAAFLMGLLGTAVCSVLSLSYRYVMISQASLDLQINAQSAILHLASELADSRSTLVKIGTTPPGVIFPSPRTAADRYERDSTGVLYWQKWVCYYYDGTANQLVRSVVTITPTTTPTATSYNTSDFATMGTRTVVARNMSALTLSGSSPILLSAGFTTSVLSVGDNQVTISDAICPRN